MTTAEGHSPARVVAGPLGLRTQITRPSCYAAVVIPETSHATSRQGEAMVVPYASHCVAVIPLIT
jgi:hypothetical protein